MGDVKQYRLKNLPSSERPEKLAKVMRELADEYGWAAVVEEAIEGAGAHIDASKKRDGAPPKYFWTDADGKKRPRKRVLKDFWMMVEIERYKRKKGGVRPTLDEVFKELKGKPWVIDLGDEAIEVKPSTAEKRTKSLAAEEATGPLTGSPPSAWARNLYIHANRLREDPKIKKDWDRSLKTAKKIIDEGWTLKIDE